MPSYRVTQAFFCVSVSQCTAPMSQPPPQQMPNPAPQHLPHPGPQPVTQLHRQEMIGSTETLGQPSEAAPTAFPYAANTLRSSSPKPDASELYLKSKALLDSKRKSRVGRFLQPNSCPLRAASGPTLSPELLFHHYQFDILILQFGPNSYVVL